MILNDDEMRSIVDLLLESTREDRIAWRHEHGQVSAKLPNRTTVEVGRDNGGPDLIIALRDDAGTLLGQVRAPAEGSAATTVSPVLRELYDQALRKAGKSVYREIVDALKLTGSATVTVATNTRPPQISDKQAAAVLKKMAGQWDLDYTRGKERATISEGGKYVVGKSTEPKFQLKVLAWNEESGTAEVAKDFFGTGKRWQIEFLTISADEMVGHAKHDMHKLVYRTVAR